ncbi:MAG: tetratricopeptide repeat protein [Terriglobales bacterium]
MAFGFGFNKQKVLSSAEKFVQQGKLQNAITEYEKIRKHDDKDLTVANTIGDLYARQGDTGKAIECFKSVGDAYAAQGFTVKGIAMYKKITKLQPSMDASLKLAELYIQQGLFNDARAQYLQVAEDFMKSGDLEQAVRLFQKVLEMDPENVPMRVKLAEVYVRLGRKKEAWEIFSAAAEALRSRGSLAGAEDILQRMLMLDPGNSYVLLLRGRAALESGNPSAALQYLEKASDIDSHADGLRDLLKAYLATGKLAESGSPAEKLLSVHNDPEGLFLLGEGAARLGHYDKALEVYSKHAGRLLTTDSTKLLAKLHALIAHVQGDAAALEKLLKLLKKSGESTHVNEVAELLAHASVKNGNLDRARELYQMLAASEPENPLHAQNCKQITERLRGIPAAAAGITAEEGALVIEELEATAPGIDQTYPDETATALRAAVTDADLFLSYNLPEKALAPLLAVLPQAPLDVRLNQRLAGLHTRAHRFAEAADCCRKLEKVFYEAGYADEADRYGELAARYEQSMGIAAPADVPARTAESGADVAPLGRWQTQVEKTSAFTAFASASMENNDDAAAEWEHGFAVDDSGDAIDATSVPASSTAGDAEIAETVEEVGFYLEHFMMEQAQAAFEKLEGLTRDAAVLDPLRKAIALGAKPEETEPEIAVAEIDAGDPPTFDIALDLSAQGSAIDAGSGPSISKTEPMHLEATDAAANDLNAFVADLEGSLGDAFLAGATAEGKPAPSKPATGKPAGGRARKVQHPADALPSWPPAAAAHAVEPASAHTNAGSGAAAATAPATSYPAASGSASTLSHSVIPTPPLEADTEGKNAFGNVDLSEMFGELKSELEEGGSSTEEDPETHYNLGVAFREMGLLDEAIAELQKVCASIERGHVFTQVVQAYTWLAQCFLDKGVPEAAIRWYEKALNIPGLDSEARVAINYELGAACERAQDRPAALRHFTYVYGANIDYRDVAERIHALKS